jgi:hypothetical protein
VATTLRLVIMSEPSRSRNAKSARSFVRAAGNRSYSGDRKPGRAHTTVEAPPARAIC